MKKLLLLALLVQFAPGVAVAQALTTPQQAATAQADPDDARKGRLLAVMARWVQQYGEESTPSVTPDSTTVLEFQQSVQANASLRDLNERVRKKLSGQSFVLAPVTQVAEAIEQVLTDRYRPRQKVAAQLPVLTRELARVLAPKSAEHSALVAAAPVAPAPVVTPVPAEVTPAVSAPADNGWLRGGMGFLFGLVAGALGCWFWLGQRLAMDRKRIREAVDREYQSVMAQADARIAALEREKQKQTARPSRTEEAVPPAKTKSPSAPLLSVEVQREFETLISDVPAAAPPEPDRTVELSVALPTPTHYYAPAPDVPYIEHRKLSPDPLAVMPIRLRVAADGSSATYGFSPEADQSRVIANDIRNLRAFFDFELPPSAQFSRIDTSRPGRLERVGERWEVREKAQLNIR